MNGYECSQIGDDQNYHSNGSSIEIWWMIAQCTQIKKSKASYWPPQSSPSIYPKHTIWMPPSWRLTNPNTISNHLMGIVALSLPPQKAGPREARTNEARAASNPASAESSSGRCRARCHWRPAFWHETSSLANRSTLDSRLFKVSISKKTISCLCGNTKKGLLKLPQQAEPSQANTMLKTKDSWTELASILPINQLQATPTPSPKTLKHPTCHQCGHAITTTTIPMIHQM